MPQTTAQQHLERRGTAYYWRRRWPKRPTHTESRNFFEKKMLFPLRTDVLRGTKVAARRLAAWMTSCNRSSLIFSGT